MGFFGPRSWKSGLYVTLSWASSLCTSVQTLQRLLSSSWTKQIVGLGDLENEVRAATRVCEVMYKFRRVPGTCFLSILGQLRNAYLRSHTRQCLSRTYGLIHTGGARTNSNANPLMFLGYSVNTPIHTHRFHLLCVLLRVLCGWGNRTKTLHSAKPTGFCTNRTCNTWVLCEMMIMI